MRAWRARLGELRRFPSAVAGLTLIALMVLLALYAMAAIPYREAVRLWLGGEGVWTDTPRLAPPAWINWFTRAKLPPTIIRDSAGNPDAKERVEYEADDADIRITLAFDYPYDAFPKEVGLFLSASFEELNPYVTVVWRTPDGREFYLRGTSVRETEVLNLSQDRDLQSQLGGLPPEVGLFAGPGSDPPKPLKGRYEVLVEGLVFEEGADLDARLVVYGRVHGLAGTDHLRRDIMVALLWGTPLALVFGLLAAVGSTISTLIVAAVGVWYGKWLDGAIQRITEVNLILPVLPILIMVGVFYSRSIWVMLGIVILLGIFSSGIKVYRAIFLQIKESPYIEAARAYGAGNLRIIFLYLIPRVIPILVPQFVVLIPSFVFLEATLAVLGLGDPVMPTWGKVLNDAASNGALYNGHYYWVLAPSFLLMITGLGFAMVGFALDRVFNPRLREQ